MKDFNEDLFNPDADPVLKRKELTEKIEALEAEIATPGVEGKFANDDIADKALAQLELDEAKKDLVALEKAV